MAADWRPLRLSDLPAANGLNRIAGWNQTEADWRGYIAFEPEGCLAVEIGGELAGTATCIRYGERLGWIGMVLVHPKFRRLGLGTELLGRTIRYLKERGTRSIRLDATAMGRTVYLPLGFRDEIEVSRFEGVGAGLSAEGLGDLARAGVEQFGRASLPTVVDMDEEMFGVRRAEVLEALSLRNPDLCFVARKGGGISGFLIAREGREAVQLGPSAARDPAAAELLYRAVFHAARGRRVFLDLPAPNLAGGGLLERHGFRVQRSFVRMILGEEGPHGRNDLIYGTSGAEKG